MVVNGGFITDLSDSNVQQLAPRPHQGVGQYPKVVSAVAYNLCVTFNCFFNFETYVFFKIKLVYLQNVSTYFAFEVSDALRRPGSATSVTTYMAEGFEHTELVHNRYNCRAYAYAGPFKCTQTQNPYYFVKVTVKAKEMF